MSSKTRAKKKQSSLFTSLPEDIIIDILARVTRCDYPTLSLVSKQFRSLVASREIYVRRSLLSCTEHCIYVVLYNRDTGVNNWYILCRKANSNRRLVLIPSLPDMSPGNSFVTVGSRIYMFGIYHKNALSIDCQSHTGTPLPRMPIPMSYSRVAGIMDKKIYLTVNYLVAKSLAVMV
ncbi:hypothetical protein EUTSA_v10015844mg [Eutrema salsugineum]|uniref:F-box domain-containing protein n=1 Tax=Eutrema salsugineum TaxID=72664 RepID=V4LQB9_EUTSA|nr:hypothetical protein EUTSA_v10015844mg [Eutrema salsugineum]